MILHLVIMQKGGKMEFFLLIHIFFNRTRQSEFFFFLQSMITQLHNFTDGKEIEVHPSENYNKCIIKQKLVHRNQKNISENIATTYHKNTMQ